MDDDSNPDRSVPARPHRGWFGSALRFLLLFFLAVAVLCAFGWSVWVYLQIEHYATDDQAAQADVICVFGAAQYDGKPSPVLRARLDHALALYEHGIAPMVLTLGGSAPGDTYSEGQVGKAYLVTNGVPDTAIIPETKSRTTDEQAERIVVIARTNGYRRIVIVSDPTHLFRIHEMCAREGLAVMTSPRPQTSAVGSSSEWQSVWHEIVTYTLWRMHLDG